MSPDDHVSQVKVAWYIYRRLNEFSAQMTTIQQDHLGGNVVHVGATELCCGMQRSRLDWLGGLELRGHCSLAKSATPATTQRTDSKSIQFRSCVCVVALAQASSKYGSTNPAQHPIILSIVENLHGCQARGWISVEIIRERGETRRTGVSRNRKLASPIGALTRRPKSIAEYNTHTHTHTHTHIH